MFLLAGKSSSREQRLADYTLHRSPNRWRYNRSPTSQERSSSGDAPPALAKSAETVESNQRSNKVGILIFDPSCSA